VTYKTRRARLNSSTPEASGVGAQQSRVHRPKYFSLTEYNGEPIVTEPGLEDCEQETAIYFSARTTAHGYTSVSSNQAPIVRGLLEHGGFVVEEIQAINREDTQIIYVAGRSPLSCIRITTPSRKQRIGEVVTQRARGRRSEEDNPAASASPASTPTHRDTGSVITDG